MMCANCFGLDESTLFEALTNIVWYDGHYVWLKELRDELIEHNDPHRFFTKKFDEWHTEKHTIWMLLVGMFGDWGTSIRIGWIDKPIECARFIEELCKEMWEEEDGQNEP